MLEEYGFVPPFLANPDILAHLTATASRHRLAPTLFEADRLLNVGVRDAPSYSVPGGYDCRRGWPPQGGRFTWFRGRIGSGSDPRSPGPGWSVGGTARS
jgi:hypothetical protein